MASIDEDIIATLRARVAALERHADLLRASRANVCGTLASIVAALDGRPASEDEPEVVQRVARLVAELAEARTRIERIHDEHRTEIGRWVKAETAARLDGARVEREACADWIRRECLPVTADRMIEARARGEGSPT